MPVPPPSKTAPPAINIPTISPSKLAENAAICMVVPLGDPADSTSLRGVSPCYWGGPGIGKSSIMRAAARMAQLHIETLYPSHHNPEDFGSIDLPDGKGGMRTVCGLPQIRRLIAKGEGVLFVDEAGNAPPAVQSASLSLILERNIGDGVLPPGIRILAAANPVECAAGGWDFEAPTANRFLHFNVPAPSNNEWLKWYMGENTQTQPSADSLWDQVTNNWPSAYPKAKGLIAGFIKSKADALYRLPGEEDPNRSRAWASPRMWEIVGRCAATCFALGRPELVDTFAHAAVGIGASTEFSQWCRDARLPSPEDMLKHGWAPDKRRLDVAIGALASLTEFVINSSDKMSLAEGAWNILDRCCQAGLTDIAMSSTEVLVQAGLADDDISGNVLLAAKPVIRHLTKSPVAKVMVP